MVAVAPGGLAWSGTTVSGRWAGGELAALQRDRVAEAVRRSARPAEIGMDILVRGSLGITAQC